MDIRKGPATRVAAVTGASSGIGRATVTRLVESGMLVIANGRRRDALEELESHLNQASRRVCAISADIRDASLVERMFRTSLENFDVEPSVMVLSAGSGQPGTLLSSDPTQWAALLETNVLAVMRQMREVATVWRKSPPLAGNHSIKDLVVVGSTVGRTLSAFNPVYGATKFALHSLVEALRQELCRDGIRVSLIEPGFVKTGFQTTAGYDMKWFGQIEEDIGSLLSPEDIARIVEFIVTSPAHVHIDDVRVRPTRQKV
jgi:NADP-dependent 3-hydroxy acid dehydrogenase YdfG